MIKIELNQQWRHSNLLRMTSKPTNINFKVVPRKSLMDETVEMTVSELTPGQEVTMVAITINHEDGAAFYSRGEFQADSCGIIDFNRSFCYGGTYTGIELMGLFWSAIPAPGQRKGLRLIKRIVDGPLDWFLFLVDGNSCDDIVENLVSHVRNISKDLIVAKGMISVEVSETISNIKSIVLGKALIQRYYCYPEDVQQIRIRDGRLRGILFVPNHPKDCNHPKIGIIDIYGGGSFKNHRAALLAERGFVVFGLAYCDYDDLPSEVDLDVDYLIEAANFMLSRRCPARISSKELGAIGLCKGAAMALELAAHHSNIKAVVAINSPCFNEIGRFRRPGSDENVAHSWTIKSPLLMNSEEGVISEGLFEWFNQQPPKQKHEIGISVENVGSILFIYGADDVSIGVRHLHYFVERLRNAKKSNFRCLVYPKTGHIIDPPIFPLCRASYWPLFKEIFVWGGEPKHHHHAQLDSWNHIIKYFKSQLSEI